MGLVWHASAPAAATSMASPAGASSSDESVNVPVGGLESSPPSPGDTSGGGQATEPGGDGGADSTPGEGGNDGGGGGANGDGSTNDGSTNDDGASDGGNDDGATGDGGGTADDGTGNDSPADDGSGTNDGGTGGSGDGGNGSGAGTGSSDGGTNTGPTSPSPPPQPTPSDSPEPDYPTVDVPSDAPVPDNGGSSGGAGPGGAETTMPTTPSGGGNDKSGDAGTEPKVEKLVLVPGSSKTASVLAGSQVSAELEGVDGDGKYRVVSGELPPGLMLDSETGEIAGTAQHVGTYSFTVEYFTKHQSSMQSYTIRIEARDVDIEMPPLEPAQAGEPYKAVALHTDGGSGPFTYTVAGSELSGTGGGNPSLKTAPWPAGDSISVADVLRGSSRLQGVGPVTQSVADSEGGAGAGHGGSQVGNLPAGMHLDGGVLTGTPKPEAAGVYTFTIVSTDRYGSTAKQQMTITVLSDGEAVPINSADSAQLAPPEQLADDAGEEAAAAQADSRVVVLPLLLGLLVLVGAASFVVLRHRAAAGTHR
ncbi:Ig domain-containing protein [Arthrobacter castelli]|uniref:Ig domain-containing protein n=1 Tax=Arthrobacter castelli TaxID=271431 RepID=UPI00138AE44A|nr:Ig domain-containing protein [Arthrobacter castelli]